MKLALVKGTSSKSVDVFIQDSSLTTGAGLTGLVFNTAGLVAYYYREGAAAAVKVDSGGATALVTMTVGTWVSCGFVAIDGTNMPGWYQLGLPNAALLTGANSVKVVLRGATNMADCTLEIQLDMPVDTALISGDSDAADNWETMLDGTGGKKLILEQLVINSSSAGGGIDIDNSAGPGVSVRAAAGAAAVGMHIQGAVDNSGLHLLTTAPGGGHGLLTEGGAMGGSGIYADGGGAGAGLKLVAGASGADLIGELIAANFGALAIEAAALADDTKQAIADALDLAPTAGAPAAKSVDARLRDIRGAAVGKIVRSADDLSVTLYDEDGVSLGTYVLSSDRTERTTGLP